MKLLLKSSHLFTLVSVGLISMTGMTCFAQASGPSKDDEVTKTINAEVQLTHQRMKNLVSQMGGLKDNPYADATYSALANDFEAKIDVALSHFDDKIQHSILPKAQYWLRKYSTTISSSQSQDFNWKYRDLIQQEINSLYSEYRDALKGIYLDALGDIPVEINEKFVGEANDRVCGHSEIILPYYYTVDSITYLSGKSVALPESFDVCYARDGGWGSPNLFVFMRGFEARDYHNTDEDNGVGDYIKHYLKDMGVSNRVLPKFFDYGCNSEPCRGLRQADYEQFTILVSNIIDKGLEFTVQGTHFGIGASRIKPLRLSSLIKQQN